MADLDRRQFLQLSAFAAQCSLRPCAARTAAGDEFYFVQLSDTHWASRARRTRTPRHAAEGHRRRERLSAPPDFVIFTGDLTHTTDDGRERRKRLAEFRSMRPARVRDVRFIPGEHDAALDRARPSANSSAPRTTPSTTRACTSSSSTTSSDPGARLGDEQLPGCGRPERSGKARHRGVHAPAAVRPVSAMGLGHARRAARRSSC
jgi:hypothetical protein